MGLGDNDIDVPTILREILDCMPKDLSKLHKVVFCFKMDRLRAKMSEDLNMIYKFFKLVGAKPENFVVCLTFCDILSDKTIQNFWEELKETKDLDMIKEIKTVTYTAFPNLGECDDDKQLHEYLEKKARVSRRRVFDSVILNTSDPFYPYDSMVRMPSTDFEVLCKVLKDYSSQHSFLFGMFKKSEQDAMMDQIKKLRPPFTGHAIKQARKSTNL